MLVLRSDWETFQYMVYRKVLFLFLENPRYLSWPVCDSTEESVSGVSALQDTPTHQSSARGNKQTQTRDRLGGSWTDLGQTDCSGASLPWADLELGFASGLMPGWYLHLIRCSLPQWGRPASVAKADLPWWNACRCEAIWHMCDVQMYSNYSTFLNIDLWYLDTSNQCPSLLWELIFLFLYCQQLFLPLLTHICSPMPRSVKGHLSEFVSSEKD